MPRSNPESCWTCRIRHKKCDEAKPSCQPCALLEISCIYSKTKPSWMDNGPMQRDMTQRIKSQVKDKANRRRCHDAIRLIEQRMHGDCGDADNKEHTSPTNGSSLGDKPRDLETLEHQESPSTSIGHVTPKPPPTTPPSDSDIQFIVSYIDHVFPIIFPFYVPSVLEGGRSWLLRLLLKNEAVLSATRALVAHVLSVIPCRPSPIPHGCVSTAQEEEQKQKISAITQLQHDLGKLMGISEANVQDNVVQAAAVLNSIVHILNAEKTISTTQQWLLHLHPALHLLVNILQTPKCGYESTWIAVLEQFCLQPPDAGYPIWSVDQAAFRFSVACLLVDDILVSISSETTPILAPHWSQILGDAATSNKFNINLEDVIGCQNWAMLAIGEVSSLASWKKATTRDGILQSTELNQRGSILEARLRDKLCRLTKTENQAHQSLEFFSLDKFAKRELSCMYPVVTSVWAYTALIYLQVVVSGWQPESHQLRGLISELMKLFTTLCPYPTLLYTLSYPLAIAGCLSANSDEEQFRNLLDRMGALTNLGPMRVTRKILDNSWISRDRIAAESLTVSACINILCR